MRRSPVSVFSDEVYTALEAAIAALEATANDDDPYLFNEGRMRGLRDAQALIFRLERAFGRRTREPGHVEASGSRWRLERLEVRARNLLDWPPGLEGQHADARFCVHVFIAVGVLAGCGCRCAGPGCAGI